MVNSSCLYECTVSHKRFQLTGNSFYYRYFMFYIELNELDRLAKKLFWFSRNRFNIFNFRDRDHLVYNTPDVRENILHYLAEQGVTETIERIYLLTNVATFGYNFNPVSFYFCFNEKQEPVCVVPEVGNTFHEIKPFFIGKHQLTEGKFSARIQKNFYVSPFINHDVYFDFQLHIPGDRLQIAIDDYEHERRIFTTHLSGRRIPLTDFALIKFALKYPMVTLKVIGAIHWQAVKLIIKKVPYFRKNEFLHLQKGAIKKWAK